jgi:hypothetical protein
MHSFATVIVFGDLPFEHQRNRRLFLNYSFNLAVP